MNLFTPSVQQQLMVLLLTAIMVSSHRGACLLLQFPARLIFPQVKIKRQPYTYMGLTKLTAQIERIQKHNFELVATQ